MVVCYHVTGPEYQDGDDLLCRRELKRQGRAPKWKWEKAEEGFDDGVVCLFEDIGQAEWFTEKYYPEGWILQVELPDTDLAKEGLKQTVVSARYRAIVGRIPARYIRPVS